MRPLLSAAAIALLCLPLSAQPAPEAAQSDEILAWMEKRIETEARTAEKEAEAPVLQLQLLVNDLLHWSVEADRGALVKDDLGRERTLRADATLGDSLLNSNRPLYWDEAVTKIAGLRSPLPFRFSEPLYDRAAKQAFFWALKGANEHFAQLRSERDVLVREESSGRDFAPGKASSLKEFGEPGEPDAATRERIKGQLLRLSAKFRNRPWLHSSAITLEWGSVVSRGAFSGQPSTREVSSLCELRVSLLSHTDDGMDLLQERSWSFDTLPASLDTALLERSIDSLIARMETLRKAPVGEPYAGPVILEGPAAAVYVHEVLGHRLESHRLRRQTDGQTFLRKRGEAVTGAEFSIVDDPTLREFGGTFLHGHYKVDEEGIEAQKAVLVENGKLVGFLTGRASAREDDVDNGHGRGFPAVSRMGNTILSSSAPVPYAELRERLIGKVKARGLPYGLVIQELQGGYTVTGRSLPQTFQLQALSAVRVWADGRPDELIRGINLSGSPLTTLSQLAGASDRPAVFNGYCGAESGWVPVSAIAPDLLFENLEAEIQPAHSIPHPILPPPEEEP